MQIHLNEQEIQEALLEHINTTGVPLVDAVTKVTLIAGRGANGHSAIIDIERKDSVNKTPESEEENEENEQAIKFDFGSHIDD